jgi:hypothetical protein
MEDINRLIATRGQEARNKSQETRVTNYSDEDGEVREEDYCVGIQVGKLEAESDEEEGEVRELKRRRV